jgi:hypothetical protein
MRLPASKTTDWYGWTDESGNSGLNIFDQEQPMFWSGTLLSPDNLDLTTSSHSEWLQLAGAQELHGQDLSFVKLNKIADSIRAYLTKHNCRFVFTRIDKSYHAITTFVTMVFDSDVNHAVEPLHDHVPLFRKELAKDLVGLFPLIDRRRFWTAYLKKDLAAFSDLLLDLEQRASGLCPDARSAHVLCEGMAWARLHPDRIIGDRDINQDSPNARALLLLVDGVHRVAGTIARVVSFSHDEQPEFQQMFQQDFDLIKNAFGALGSQYARQQANPVRLFHCPLRIVSSMKSVGLQLIDVLLRLMSRHLNGSYMPREDPSGELLQFIRDQPNAIINQILFNSDKEFSFGEFEQLAYKSSLITPGSPSFETMIKTARKARAYRATKNLLTRRPV